jgi:glycosyltransferase involved in cell wall biosynthesis
LARVLPMFTVVIPLFEKGPYVRRALESVCAQTVPAAEIIVVNDGSTDGGDEVVRAFVPPAGGPRVRVIDQPNRGVSSARNAGVAAATQTYVAFLDADDRWAPEFLTRMRELIEQCPGSMLYGAGFVTTRDGRELRRYGVVPAEIEGGDPQGGRVDFFRGLAREFIVHSSSMVVPKAVLERIGGFPEGVTHGEDFLVWAKLALAGPVVLTPEPLAAYDVGVPGQAVAYWQGGYRTDFSILAYHRFLAEEVRKRADSPSDSPRDSFTVYAVGQLETAALQRLYWGQFQALAEFVQELGLDTLPLSRRGRLACWIARHRIVWPAVATMMAAVRLGRESLKRCRRVAFA